MSKLGTLLTLTLMLFAWPLHGSQQNSSTFDWVTFHNANDRGWAVETGLSLKDVRNLRHAAGIADDEPSNPLQQIDARTLPDERVLLVTAAGSGHCLEVNVFQRSFRDFKEIWSTHETPDGSGLCHPPLCRNPVVSADKKNHITILIPVQLENAVKGVCDEDIVLTYRGKGKTYVLTSSERRTKRCFIEDYQHIVQLALTGSQSSVAASQTLVTITFFPSFVPGYSIVLEKTANGFAASRLSFVGSIRSQLDIWGKFQTPSQCLAAAGSLPVDRTPINISSNDIERLLNDLHRIDLHTDTCPRLASGSCARFEDGSSYLLTMEDGKSLYLSNVEGSKSVTSENPALLHWLSGLRKLIKARESEAPK